jgi:hypothetical protein
VSLTAETDKQTYNLVAEGHFQLVYATPEILIKRGSRFQTIVIRRDGSTFAKKLFLIAVDEAHIKPLWGPFRPEYRELPILRDYFPTASIVALSATFSRKIKRHIMDSMSMIDPICIQRSIRRRNICKIVSAIQRPGYADLNILLPEDISTRNDIPTTLIFRDSIQGGIEIARYLRQRLPPHLRDDDKEIIRVYAGFLPDDVRSLYEQDIVSGRTRIMICTDACGMGVDLRGIMRVIQWKVTSNLGIEGMDQRAGRGGRDRDEPLAIAITFMDPSLITPLLQKYRDLDPIATEDEAVNGDNNDDDEDDDDDDDERNIDKTLQQETKRSRVKQPIDIPKLLFRLTTAVTPSNRAEVESLVAEIATMSSGSLSSRDHFDKAWYKQDPGGLWYMNVCNGCRHRVLMALFDDPDTFRKDDILGEISLCCDICIKAALDANLLPECPVIHGIPVSIGIAFQIHTLLHPQPKVNPAKPKNTLEALPSNRVQIARPRIDKVKDAIRAWRGTIATKVIPPHQVFSEKAIGKIGTAVKTREPTEALIREALEQSGISATTSGIRNHIPAIVQIVIESLAKSIDEQHPASRPPDFPAGPKELPFFVTSGQIEYLMWVKQQGELERAAAEKERENNLKRKKQQGQHHRNTRPRTLVETTSNINTVIRPLHGSWLTNRTGVLFPNQLP